MSGTGGWTRSSRGKGESTGKEGGILARKEAKTPLSWDKARELELVMGKIGKRHFQISGEKHRSKRGKKKRGKRVSWNKRRKTKKKTSHF